MNKKEILDVLEMLYQIEVRGKANIFLLFNLMGFFQKKLAELESSEEKAEG